MNPQFYGQGGNIGLHPLQASRIFDKNWNSQEFFLSLNAPNRESIDKLI